MAKTTIPSNDRDILKRILSMLEDLRKPSNHPPPMKVYDNKALMELLNVKGRYLKKLRDNGYIGYTAEGEKYWYTQTDVEKFLKRFHYKDFSTASSLPFDTL